MPVEGVVSTCAVAVVLVCRSSEDLYLNSPLSEAAAALWRLPLIYIFFNFIRFVIIFMLRPLFKVLHRWVPLWQSTMQQMEHDAARRSMAKHDTACRSVANRSRHNIALHKPARHSTPKVSLSIRHHVTAYHSRSTGHDAAQDSITHGICGCLYRHLPNVLAPFISVCSLA